MLLHSYTSCVFVHVLNSKLLSIDVYQGMYWYVYPEASQPSGVMSVNYTFTAGGTQMIKVKCLNVLGQLEQEVLNYT